MVFIDMLPYRLRVLIDRLLKRPTPPRQRKPASIVPTETIAGHALIMVITIMTFLAALSIGAVDIVHTAASSWESQVAREVTVQVLPRGDRNIDADVEKVQSIITSTTGITTATVLSDAEIGALLQPWLGSGLSLESLPTPKLIVLKIDDATTINWEKLKTELATQVPTASLDDHRLWMEKLRSVGRNFVISGLIVVVLVMVATALCVLFATRGAMSGNSDIVNVLHIVGARDSFIARAFERRFLSFGLKGGALGGGLGAIVFLLTSWLWNRGSPSMDSPTQALFGNISISLLGYMGVLAVVIFIALLTAITSRIVVMSHLKGMP